MINQTISHFKIIKKLGEGGMGELYLAEDNELHRTTAIKFLSSQFMSDPESKSRFKREARAAAALKHPNIITIYEMGDYEDRFYIAMEYVDGRSLNELIKQEDLSIDAVFDIAIQICEGLSKAHNTGIVHRDIKPANIMIDKDGLVKILDFGIAKIKDASQSTSADQILGTLAYMSPEQARGEKMDQRSDIFSLGVVLYELITRKHPFGNENSQAVFYLILNEEPEPLARYKKNVTAGLQRIIDKALDKDRETRYQHCDELIADLKREKKEYLNFSRTALQPELKSALLKTQTMVNVAREDQSLPKPKNKFRAPLMTIGILVISVIGIYFMNRGDTKKETQQNLALPSNSAPETEPPTSSHSALISQISKILDVNILKQELLKYSQEMRLAVGNKEDFTNPEGCYVFVHDDEKVLGVFIYRQNVYYDVNLHERFSSLADKFGGMSAIWVQDFSELNPNKNIQK